jgi:CRISPR-associated endonuclease/helicase Cas3
MMERPTTSQFADFFRAVNNAEAFPWQRDLVAEVAATGRWPLLLDLPTASGKTSVIDAAVFLMAVRDDMPRRVVFVIDRRVVVQQAAERARKLAEQLRLNDDPAVRLVAARLRRPATPAEDETRTSEPLQWTELRGGIVRDETWITRPDVPAVIVSTVDQVGSRLLFRGYGISPRMWPIHAGLLANDTLFLLDEVHLSQPFAQTLGAIAFRYRRSAGNVLPDRWQVVELSATPDTTSRDREPFRLSDRDRDPGSAPLLAKRLAARKFAAKQLVKGSGSRPQELAKRAARIARQFAVDGRVVGVLVNRVNTGRLVHDQLGCGDTVDSCLITGRMRPVDRDDILRGIKDRIRTGRSRDTAEQSLIVVGTQSVEAGADFDFDALITECASFDALRQRFGRVDRNGDLSDRGTDSASVILAHADDVKKGATDAVYGEALAKTWAWLPERRFDFTALKPDSGTTAELTVRKPHAPVLLPSHLDRWVQTSQVPDADPVVAHWLHGTEESASADVNVVWRADLTAELLELEKGRMAADLLSACPPGSGEAMSVPLPAVRAWLADAGRRDVEVADLEGVSAERPDDAPISANTPIRPVLRWQDDSQTARLAGDIRPGDTLVVPATYGGVAAGNWAPADGRPVTDLGHRVQLQQRGRLVLRLNPGFFDDDFPHPPLPASVDPYSESDEESVGDWLNEVGEASSGTRLIDSMIRWLQDNGDWKVTRVPSVRYGQTYVVMSSRHLSSEETQALLSAPPEPAGSAAEAEPETSSFTGVPVPLKTHLDNVGNWAAFLARNCGLPSTLVGDMQLAGRLHDLGKADLRFQEILQNDAALAPGLLAKSGRAELTWAERNRVTRKAGYPAGGRHELLSLALVQDKQDIESQAADWDLVLHLVASHHGWCRPFAPVVADRDPVPVRVPFDGVLLEHSSATGMARIDSGVADRFWRLVRRYGWFGLAWLECLLRLADHRASEEEQRKWVSLCSRRCAAQTRSAFSRRWVCWKL